MKYKILISFILLSITLFYSCNDTLTGDPKIIEPPTTKIVIVEKPNSIDNPYSPILTLHWKGMSEQSIVKGFWVSYKTYYLNRNDSLIQEPYFVEAMQDTIIFPSADSINKQVITVRAEDIDNNIDPIGDQIVYYTKTTFPPETSFTFPPDSTTFFIIDRPNVIWKGIKLSGRATTNFGNIKDYSFQVDDNPWTEWNESSEYNFSLLDYPDLQTGYHKIRMRSRNSALVEDKTPTERSIRLIIPSKDKEWLVVDDSHDGRGRKEDPKDEFQDDFYNNLMQDKVFEVWDVNNDGPITKEILGQYKYVFWHSDNRVKTSVHKSIGEIIDYMAVGGRMIFSTWNSLGYLKSSGLWKDYINLYGDFFNDILHIDNDGNNRPFVNIINEAYMVGVTNNHGDTVKVDMSMLKSIRKGLFDVNSFDKLGAFTEPLFYYVVSEEAGVSDVVNLTNKVVGYSYHNSQFQFVVTGFPISFLDKENAKIIFDECTNYLLTNFPY